ncbi:MFS transporter [Arthrobacter sp. H20]|uniref:MFS transporter n=1 Tax=Arthrobacter sp. H20 TaxID=1267981 RepID=UPI00047A3DE2|nr:MFS transporter [Arthrobacter sp. H20]
MNRLFNRRFAGLLGGVTAANLADGVVLLAFPLTAVSLGASAWQVAVITACMKLPWLFLGLFVGVFTDRCNRLTIATAAAFTRLFILAALTVIMIVGPNLWTLVVGALVLGACEVFYDTATQTLTPAVVHRDDLVRANSYIWSAQSVSNEFIGPPLGGLLVALALWAPFAAGSAAYICVALVMVYLARTIHQDAPTRPREQRAFQNGIRFVFSNPFLRRLTVYLGAIYIVFGAWMGLFVFYLLNESEMGLSTAGVGLLMGVSAIGGVVGSQITSSLVRWVGEYIVLALGAVGWALFMIAVLVSTNFWVVAGLMALGSTMGTAMGVASFALRQLTTRSGLLGRVGSVFRLVTWGSIPVGNLIGGALSTWLGVSPTMWGATSIMFFLVVVSVLVFRGRGAPPATSAGPCLSALGETPPLFPLTP